MKPSWFLTSLFGLIVAFVICYLLQWILWEWSWLAIPVWIAGYWIYHKYGIIGKKVGVKKLKKSKNQNL